MDKMKVSNPNNLPLIDYRELIELQPNSFKDLSEKNFDKLSNSFKIHGFITPYFVWKDKDKHYILDGHQRTRVLSRLEPNGLEVPYIEIEAKNKQEAAKKLLAIDSRYGKRTAEGEQEFLDIFEIEQGYTEEVVVLEFEYAEEVEPEPEEEGFATFGLKITFDNPEHLQQAENEFQEILDRKYPGATMKV
jgi:hypothetical protein